MCSSLSYTGGWPLRKIQCHLPSCSNNVTSKYQALWFNLGCPEFTLSESMCRNILEERLLSTLCATISYEVARSGNIYDPKFIIALISISDISPWRLLTKLQNLSWRHISVWKLKLTLPAWLLLPALKAHCTVWLEIVPSTYLFSFWRCIEI